MGIAAIPTPPLEVTVMVKQVNTHKVLVYNKHYVAICMVTVYFHQHRRSRLLKRGRGETETAGETRVPGAEKGRRGQRLGATEDGKKGSSGEKEVIVEVSAPSVHLHRVPLNKPCS